MKKIILSLVAVFAVVAVAAGITWSQFNDSETSTDNSFAAGTLDLKVNDADSMATFTVENMVPGQTKGSPTYTLRNAGTVPGVVTMKVKNVRTEENGVTNPETKAGDSDGTRLDPDNFTIATSGQGELLDQLILKFWVDDTPGDRPAPFDWQDLFKTEVYPDESSYYSLPVDTDLMAGKNIVMNPGDVLYMGSVAKFIDDVDAPYGWILDGVLNNATMSDSVVFDLEVGLKQVNP